MLLIIISLPGILSRIRSQGEITFIVVFLALWLLFFTVREKLRVYRTRTWPKTDGDITEVSVKKVGGGINGVDYWKVSLEYSYRVQQEHAGKYSFNCTSENMGNGAVAGLAGKTVAVHYQSSDEAKSLLWEDEVWDIWWDTYWNLEHAETGNGETEATSS